MKFRHMMLLSIICVMNYAIAMEIVPQVSWYNIPEVLIRIAAISEDNDKQTLCSVSKQLYSIAGKKNIDNLLQYPYKLNRTYLSNCMITYAVAKNEHMVGHALHNASLWNLKDMAEVLYYFVEQSDLSLGMSNTKERYENTLRNMMAIYRGEPAMYSAYKERFKAKVRNNDTPSLLQIAVNSQHLLVVELLLEQEKRGIVDLRTTAGLPPLNSAVTYFCASELEALSQSVDKSATIVELLCRHPKTNINEFDDQGCSALMISVAVRNVAMVKLLLRYNADPVTKSHVLQLHGPCIVESSEEIKWLLNEAVTRRAYERLNNRWEGFKSSVEGFTSSVTGWFA